MKTRMKRNVAVLLMFVFVTIMAMPVSAHKVTTVSAAADFRSAFGMLLGEHMLLASVAMQKGYDGAEDFDETTAALNANTEDVTAAIASIYGEDAGNTFNRIWNDHIGYFVNYVTATAANDTAGQKKAQQDLSEYRDEFAAFLASATGLPKQDLTAGVQMHIDHLTLAFDHYVAGEYEESYANIREGYTHMIGTADLLANTIIALYPEKFDNSSAMDPAVDLRIALGRMLGEHVPLAVVAMQKGLDGASDFEAAAAALMANADEASSAIGSIYGKEAGAEFERIWKDHIGYFVNFVVATAKQDETGRQAAQADLTEYRMEFAAFLAGATKLPESDLNAGVQEHVNHLSWLFDNYNEGKFDKVYPDLRMAYQHMFHTGDLLSEAIVGLFPDMFHEAPANVVSVWLGIGSKELKVDGQTTALDVAPFIQNGSTYVSLRALAEAVGAEVEYDGDKRTVTITAGEAVAVFWLDSDWMELNGMKMQVSDKVFIKNGRTQVPLRFAAELLGWEVEWNNSDWSIALTKSMPMEGNDEKDMTHSH